MKPEYSNRTIMDEKTTLEMVALTWKKRSKPIRIFLFVLAGISLLYGVWIIIQQGVAGGRVMLLMALFAVVAVVVAQWGYMLRAAGAINRQRKVWGDRTLEKTVHFFQNDFEQESRLGKLKFTYSKITAVLVGKNTVVLMIDKAVLQMTKIGFEEGKYEEFMQFLAKKVPALNLSK